ncbi:MAG: PAS domain S-box protein [Bacteroidota bacterium]
MPSTLFERLPQAALLLAPSEARTTITAVNTAALRRAELSRIPGALWVDADLYAAFPWMAEADIARQAAASLQTQAAPPPYACHVAHGSEALGYVDVTLTPLDDGQVLLTLGAVQPVPLSAQLTDRLNATLDSIPDAIVLTGPDRRITRINPAFQALFGYTAAEVMGQTTELLYESPEAFRRMGRERFNLSAEEKRKPYHIRYRRKNGSVFTSETVGTAVRSSNGEVLGFLGLIRDITQRNADEQALRDSQRFVERVAQALPDILYVFDLQERRNVYANRELTAVLGYSGEDVQAMGDQLMPNLLHPDDMDDVFAHFGRMQHAGAGDVLEITYRMRHRAGDWRWLHSRETPLAFTPEGTVSQYVGIAQDITARRAATEALKASEERLELALYGGDLGLWDWSVGTSKVIMNDRWAQMVGYTLDELSPDFSTWEHLIHPDDLPPTVERLEAHLAGQTSIFESELRMRHKQGHWVWVLTRGRVTERDVQGNPVRVAGTHLDITERHQAEASLQAYATALEQSNIELEQFAYLASHDLQEPLRTMRSFLDLLERDIGDDLHGNPQQYMGFIAEAAERMQALIAALFELSHAGSRDLDLQPVNLITLTEQTIGGLQAALHEQGATVTYDDLPTVTADPTLIGLVLQNLISNGLKFRSEAAPAIHLSAGRRGQMWQIAVRDNGIGIAPAFHARVFEIFKRLHHRTEYKGTGIGLAICKKIVERHGGTISIESEAGAGATFTFTLPATR